MPPLIAYMITRMGLGFFLGGASATVLLIFNPQALGSPSSPLEYALVIYGFAAPFAIGYLATELAMESE